MIYRLSNRDAAIYALGVGACSGDAVNEDELKYVYHENGQKFIQVFLIQLSLFCIDLPQNSFASVTVGDNGSYDCCEKKMVVYVYCISDM